MQPQDPKGELVRTGPQLQVIAGGKQDACDQVRDDLAAWADDGLDAEQARAVSDHVRTCKACAQEARALREVLASLRDADDRAMPARDTAFWQQLHTQVMAEVDKQPRQRALWQVPAVRWGLATAIAAVLVGLVAAPLGRWLANAPVQADERVDDVAVYGTASEAVAADRAFVDDLAASDDDPLGTVDDFDDLDDVDLDALGTALDDDEALTGQGA